MDSETIGESSSKRHESDDKMDAERPLKKARFAWQVKGKYHLKNHDNGFISDLRIVPKNNMPLESEDDSSDDASSSNSEEEAISGNAEQNLEILGDYLLNQDFNTLENAVNFQKEKADQNKICNISNKVTLNERTLGSKREDENDHGHIVPVPLSMVQMSRPSVEDECLARWQARQMAKGFVDNTINRVLDSWLVSPFPLNAENANHPALDVAEFLDNLPANNNIENEGILMAISAHGLQNNVLNNSNSSEMQSQRNLAYKNLSDEISSSSRSTMFGSNNLFPLGWNKAERPCTCSDSLKSSLASTDLKPLLPFHRRNQSLDLNDLTQPDPQKSEPDVKLKKEKKENTQNSPKTPEAISNTNMNDEFDFMDAAVSFAIQNKGLTSFENDFG